VGKEALLRGTFWDMPGSQYTQSDSQEGSTWLCSLLTTITVAICENDILFIYFI